MNIIKNLVFYALLLSTQNILAQDPHWKFRLGYYHEKISYGLENNIGSFEVQYNRPRSWGLRAKWSEIYKLHTDVNAVTLGAYVWLTDSTVFSTNGTHAPKEQLVYPFRDYDAKLSQILWKVVTPSVKYRYVEYVGIKNHVFSTHLSIYFLKYWQTVFSKFWNYTVFPDRRKVQDHIYKGLLYFRPNDNSAIFGGYAWGSESFDQGSLNITTGRFFSNIYIGGFQWEFYNRFGVEFTTIFEDRNTGIHVRYYDIALTKKIYP